MLNKCGADDGLRATVRPQNQHQGQSFDLLYFKGMKGAHADTDGVPASITCRLPLPENRNLPRGAELWNWS